MEKTAVQKHEGEESNSAVADCRRVSSENGDGVRGTTPNSHEGVQRSALCVRRKVPTGRPARSTQSENSDEGRGEARLSVSKGIIYFAI